MNFIFVANFFLGVLAGIFFRSFFGFGLAFVTFLFCLSFVIFLVYKIRSGVETAVLPLAALFLFSFALGNLRYDFVHKEDLLGYLGDLSGKEVRAEVVVVDEPYSKERSLVLVAKAEKLSLLSGDFREIKTQPFKVLILGSPYSKFKYGDKLAVYGRLSPIKNFSDNFDYVSYLAKDEIYYQFLRPKTIFISGGHGFFLQDYLFQFKNLLLDNVNVLVPEPESSLLNGIILGVKSSLDKDLVEDFKRVGLIHIVALSGYNVTVVADSLMKAIWFLPVTIRLIFGTLTIIMFAMMTGGGATVVRASIMVVLAMIARVTGRVYLVGFALLTAATLMIVNNPKILVFDVSFQLSFLATAGLIFFTPLLDHYFWFIPEKFKLKEFTVSTIAAQIAVWPFILYKMGTFSLVSIPVNIIITPIIPLVMFLGFLLSFSGFISYYLSLIFSWPVHALLFYIIKTVEIFAALPIASLSLETFPLSLTVAIYVFYSALLSIFFSKDKGKEKTLTI